MSTTVSAERRVRTFPVELAPVKRSADGEMRIKGVAIVYNSPSPPEHLPYREVIKPGALRDALAKNDDLLLVVGHDRARPLARVSAGTLTLRDTQRGLEFEALLPQTTDGRDQYELIRSRIVKGCSFAFRPDPKSEDWRFENGEEWLYVSRIESLHEITLTADPVYTSTEAEARDVVARARQTIRRHRIAARDRSPYGETSEHSFFRDLATVAQAVKNTRGLVDGGAVRFVDGMLHESGLPDREHGGLTEARKRLATSIGVKWEDVGTRSLTMPAEYRDIGSGALTGEIDTATGVPAFIVGTLGEAVRARAVLANAIEQIELPKGFILPDSVLKPAGYVSTPAVAAAQSAENVAATSTDISSTTTALKPAMIDGQFTLSRQLVDRGIGVDVLIARELGGAIGAALEVQIVDGSGASGQLLGIRNVASKISVTYVDATPTVAEFWPVLQQLRSQVAEGSGEMPAIVAMRPRRWSWMSAAIDTANAWAQFTRGAPDLRLVETIGIGATYGAGTEDVVVVLTPGGLVLATRPEQLLVTSQTAEKMTFAGWRYAALVARQPKGVGLLSGSGLAAPAGF